MRTRGDDNELGAFLRARRARLSPADVGFGGAGRRRVPGLRREEVATLAELSVTYYIRLEQGRDRRPSGDVVDALGRALRLDDAGLRHLRGLAGLAPSAAREPDGVREPLRRLLDRHVTTPAFVMDRLSHVLAVNELARGLHPSYQVGRNLLRDLFLDPEARAAYAPEDLPGLQRDAVAVLRAAPAGELVEELLADETFARLWASHEVIEKRAGVLRLDHPELGRLVLDADVFDVSGEPGQRLVILH